MSRLASIGECMAEFRRGADGRFDLAYGGDTFNTAVYLCRLGVASDFVTLLGDDPFSDAINATCQSEGVGTGLIGRLPGRSAGLYVIETDSTGERTFHYWRDRSPVRDLFDHEFGGRVIAALPSYDMIYLSGITLSLFSDRALDVLFEGLDAARKSGAEVAFDGNFRAKGWPDRDRARAIFQQALKRTDIVLPTFDDDHVLFGDGKVSDTVERYRDYGIREVVIKDGKHCCTIATEGEVIQVEAERVPRPVDTTAAGDSFNAGYLASRLTGNSPAEAALLGHQLASTVIQHPGAIIPKSVLEASGLRNALASARALK